MARRIDPICLECSRLSQQTAITLHSLGSSERTCWDAKRCPRKRSHYRHREHNLVKLRMAYRASTFGQNEAPATEYIDIPIEAPPAAFLCLFRGRAKDAPLHALGVQVIQGNQVIALVEPQHFMGLKNRHVNEYLHQVLKVLHERYGIAEFERHVIRLEPEECPIQNCPLHKKPSFNWN